MDQSSEEAIQKLQDKIFKAERERDAWRGKPSEHYKMACILVEALKRELAALLQQKKSCNKEL